MSQIYDLPIIVGSYAALSHNILPPWRNGLVRDIDILCPLDTADKLSASFSSRTIKQAPNHRTIFTKPLRLDIDERQERYERARPYCSPFKVTIENRFFDCLIAQPSLLFAMRQASRLSVISHLDKANKDCLWFEQLGIWVPPSIRGGW